MKFNPGDTVMVTPMMQGANHIKAKIQGPSHTEGWYWLTCDTGDICRHESDFSPYSSPPSTIKEAFEQYHEAKRPKYTEVEANRVREGKCPKCGTLGRYHLSTPICEEHGPY